MSTAASVLGGRPQPFFELFGNVTVGHDVKQNTADISTVTSQASTQIQNSEQKYNLHRYNVSFQIVHLARLDRIIAHNAVQTRVIGFGEARAREVSGH